MSNKLQTFNKYNNTNEVQQNSQASQKKTSIVDYYFGAIGVCFSSCICLKPSLGMFLGIGRDWRVWSMAEGDRTMVSVK